MRSRLVSPAMAMSKGLPEGLSEELGRWVLIERPHIVLLRKDQYSGYYYLSLVSV